MLFVLNLQQTFKRALSKRHSSDFCKCHFFPLQIDANLLFGNQCKSYISVQITFCKSTTLCVNLVLLLIKIVENLCSLMFSFCRQEKKLFLWKIWQHFDLRENSFKLLDCKHDQHLKVANDTSVESIMQGGTLEFMPRKQCEA